MGSGLGAKSSSASISAAVQAGAALVGGPTAKVGLALVGNAIAKEISGRENNSLSKGSTGSKSSTGSGTNVAAKSSAASNNNAVVKSVSVVKTSESSISSSGTKSSSGTGSSIVSSVSKATSGILSSISPNIPAKVIINDKIGAVVKAASNTLSKTATVLNNSDKISEPLVATAGVTYASNTAITNLPEAGLWSLELRDSSSSIMVGPTLQNISTNSTKPKVDDKLKHQEQEYYKAVSKAKGIDPTKIEKKAEGNLSKNENNFTTKVKISDTYSSKNETTVYVTVPPIYSNSGKNSGKDYTNNPSNWKSELEKNVDSKTSKSTRILPTEVRLKLERMYIETEKKALRTKYGAVYNGTDTLVHDFMATITGRPNVHNTLEPLFEENKKTPLASGLDDGFDFGLATMVGDELSNTPIINKIVKRILKKSDDGLKAITETASKNVDEVTKEIEMAAKSGVEGGLDVIKKGNLDDLPDNALEMFGKYDKAGWQGTVPGQTPGTAAGSKYLNKDGKLPTMDNAGNSMTYKEFDVNNKLPNANRDAQRFLKGSDGSIYYTDDHYSTFIKIK